MDITFIPDDWLLMFRIERKRGLLRMFRKHDENYYRDIM